MERPKTHLKSKFLQTNSQARRRLIPRASLCHECKPRCWTFGVSGSYLDSRDVGLLERERRRRGCRRKASTLNNLRLAGCQSAALGERRPRNHCQCVVVAAIDGRTCCCSRGVVSGAFQIACCMFRAIFEVKSRDPRMGVKAGGRMSCKSWLNFTSIYWLHWSKGYDAALPLSSDRQRTAFESRMQHFFFGLTFFFYL